MGVGDESVNLETPYEKFNKLKKEVYSLMLRFSETLEMVDMMGKVLWEEPSLSYLIRISAEVEQDMIIETMETDQCMVTESVQQPTMMEETTLHLRDLHMID